MSMDISQKQPYDSGIPLPFTYQRIQVTLKHGYLHTPVCCYMFTISKLYNQSRYLSMDEGIKKKEYIEFRHTVEFCLVTKSEILFCL